VSEIIPVALFAYRRADLLERTLASLRANGVSKIYAFSDGPREPSVALQVDEVRAVLRGVDWCAIEISESSTNRGIGVAMLSEVSKLFERHESLVIVEEDLEFVPGTYAFLCAALQHYRDDPRAMGVTAWTHARVTPRGVTQPFFTGRMATFVWATWRRAWAGMGDATALQRRDECLAEGIDPARFGDDLVESPKHEVEKAMWDVRFNLHMLARRGLFLYPAASMVRHTGYDSRAMNLPSEAGWEDVVVPAPVVRDIRWPTAIEYPGSDLLWRCALNAPKRTLLSRTRKRISLWFGS
jgi:hypothetical protein